MQCVTFINRLLVSLYLLSVCAYSVRGQLPSYNYADLTQKALYFFEVQRSGKLPPYGQ